MPCGVFKERYEEDMAFLRYPIHWAALAASLAFLLALPFIAGSEYTLCLAITVGIFAVSALGLNVIMGYAGLISLAHAGLMGVGAVAAVYAVEAGVPLPLALLVGGAAAALVGLAFGLPSLRLKDYYLALASLAGQLIIEYWLARLGYGGVIEAPEPRLLGISLASPIAYYYFVLGIAALSFLLVANMARSYVGRALVAIRDNDVAAEIAGVNVVKYKLIAFLVGSFLAGVAGSLWAFYLGVVSVEDYNLMASIWLIAMVLVGGMGRVWGSLLGAMTIGLLPTFLNQALPALLGGLGSSVVAGVRDIIFGSIIVAVVILEPEGLIAVLRRIKEYFRLWPFSY